MAATGPMIRQGDYSPAGRLLLEKDLLPAKQSLGARLYRVVSSNIVGPLASKDGLTRLMKKKR